MLDNQIYYILKTIKELKDSNSFDIDSSFDLSKLKMSQSDFYHLIGDLIDENYISGIKMRFSSNDIPSLSITNPKVTKKGLEFLENNTALQKIYHTVKEINSFIKQLFFFILHFSYFFIKRFEEKFQFFS